MHYGKYTEVHERYLRCLAELLVYCSFNKSSVMKGILRLLLFQQITHLRKQTAQRTPCWIK